MFLLTIYLPWLLNMFLYSYWASTCTAALPTYSAFMISVRQASDLPPASFRFPVTQDTLALGYILPAVGRIRDFHPLKHAPAGRTVMKHGNEGIAIQTCFQNLAECFDTDRALTNLRMKYIDYNAEFLDYSYPNYPVYLSIKDVKYKYENELRVITLEKEYPEFDADEMNMNEKIVYSQKGEFIKIDLKILIQNLYLSPNSTIRFKENIEQLLHKYDITVPVIKSV